MKQDGRNGDHTGHCDFLLPSLIIGTGEIMANYAIMRIEKRKLGAVGRICKHNERLKTEYKSNPDIDPERSHLNYHLVTPKDNYRKEVLDRITHAGARMRKDSVVMQDCFIGATPEWIRAKSPQEQKENILSMQSGSLRTISEKRTSSQQLCIWMRQLPICTFVLSR